MRTSQLMAMFAVIFVAPFNNEIFASCAGVACLLISFYYGQKGQ